MPWPFSNPPLALPAALLQTISMPTAQAVSPDLVVSQVYGGGGNSGATLTNDFIEIYNRGAATVSVDGWSVQYASSAGRNAAHRRHRHRDHRSARLRLQQLPAAADPCPHVRPDQPAAVTPVAPAQTSTDPVFDRPPLIQTFERTGGSEAFKVVVNHFKSKNCAAGSDPLDTDQGDGQSCFNNRRVLRPRPGAVPAGCLSGLRPRPADRRAHARHQRGADGGRRWAVRRGRGLIGHADRDRGGAGHRSRRTYRHFVITFVDGTSYTADFRFKG
jgi:predicted extracellular nuclease